MTKYVEGVGGAEADFTAVSQEMECARDIKREGEGVNASSQGLSAPWAVGNWNGAWRSGFGFQSLDLPSLETGFMSHYSGS